MGNLLYVQSTSIYAWFCDWKLRKVRYLFFLFVCNKLCDEHYYTYSKKVGSIFYAHADIYIVAQLISSFQDPRKEK